MNISNFAFALLAEAEAAANTASEAAENSGAAGSSSLSLILMFAALFLVMWFIMIRPQQNEQKRFNQMLDSLKVGDKVLTTSGMKASITNIIRGSKNEIIEIQLLLDDKNNVKVMFDPRAIAYVINPEEDKK